MSKQELNDCLKSFYTSARKQDEIHSCRHWPHRFLRSPPHCKQISIIGDPAFTEANQVLDAFVKDLRKTGKIAGVVHKKPITKQQIQRLYECGELGPANSTNPAQLQRTVWFYLVLYFGQSAAWKWRPCSAQPISTLTVQCKQHSVHRTWWTDLPTTAVQFQQLQRPNSQPLRPVQLNNW